MLLLSIKHKIRNLHTFVQKLKCSGIKGSSSLKIHKLPYFNSSFLDKNMYGDFFNFGANIFKLILT